jgi:hypothetical protein
MEKDREILKLVERMKLNIDFSLLDIVDYWEADLCAIGLVKDKKVVYISIYNYIEKEELMYDYDLERIDENDKEKYDVVRVGRNVSETELVREIKLFLEV